MSDLQFPRCSTQNLATAIDTRRNYFSRLIDILITSVPRYLSIIVLKMIPILLIVTPASADPFNKLGPYRYLKQGTFGLEIRAEPPKVTHRIAAYLPHTALIFYHPIYQTKDIDGKLYRAIVTQFGQELWVLSGKVANDNTFKGSYGKQTLIFHQDAYFCPEYQKRCLENSDDAIDIIKGQVLEIREKPTASGEYYLLYRSTRTDNAIGYLPEDKFKSFERSGILTDANNQYPAALLRGVRELKKVRTNCGEKWTGATANELAEELKISAGTPSFFDVIKLRLGISITRSVEDKLESAFGGDNIATRRYELVVGYPNESGQFPEKKNKRYYMSQEIHCVGVSQDKEAIHIVGLILRSETGLLAVLRSNEFYEPPQGRDFISEDDMMTIYQNNGRRIFLTSLSSREDYRKAIEIILKKMGKLGDVNLANILLSTINATCPDEERTQCGNTIKVK